jgi:hypothetical protein
MSQNYNVRGKLTVTVVQARNVVVKQLIGEMDPFAVVTIKGEKFKTPVAENGHRNPKWNFSFIANLDGDEDGIHIKLNNKGNVTDDLIARCDILLPDCDMSGKPVFYSLRDPDQFSKECGDIEIGLVFEGTGLPLGSKALTTHEARTRGPAPVAAAQPQYATQPGQPQYAQQPQQQQPMYAQPPQQQPMYAQPQQQQPQYAPIPQQQPQYAPIPQQQPVYQQPQPVYQQPIYQQPAQITPVYQAPPVAIVQPVIYTQPVAQPSFASSLAIGMGNMVGQMAQLGAQLGASVMAGHFDSNGYLNQHPDVRAAGMDAWAHYTNYGHSEGRILVLTNGQRGKWDSAGYLQLHPDVAKAGMDAWTHFKTYGKNENRQIMVSATGGPAVTAFGMKGKWDSAAYLRIHPDVAKAGMDAWHHYKTYGYNERRTIAITTGQQGKWDSNGYLQSHPDVAKAGMDAWSHFTQWGKTENRDISLTPA